MKKILPTLIALVLAAGIVLYGDASLRRKAAPYLPAAVTRLLPQDQTAGGAPVSGDQAAGKSGNHKGGAAITVLVAEAQSANMPLIERTFGTLQSPAVATINARVASQVTEVHVKDGQMVKAGDLLVVLDDRLLQAQLAKDQAQLAKDQALAVSNELDAQRAAQLAQRQAGPQQTADQAKATAQAAQATVDSDKAAILADQAQLSFTRISAPISGRLGTVAVNVGDLVTGTVGTTGLMTITEMQPLKVVFHLPEQVLTPIRKAQADGTAVVVRVKRSGTDTVLDQGPLDFIDSSVDTSSGTIAMSATLANDTFSMWPGEFGDVEVEYGKLEDAVEVPTVAVQAGQNGPFVWRVKPDNTVEARNITVARTEGDRTAAATGLAVGDRVVVEGQLRLKPGAAITISTPAKATSSGAKTAVSSEQASQ